MRLMILLAVLALTGCDGCANSIVTTRVRCVLTFEDKDKYGGDWGTTVEVIPGGQRFVVNGKLGETGDEFNLRVERFRTYTVGE